MTRPLFLNYALKGNAPSRRLPETDYFAPESVITAVKKKTDSHTNRSSNTRSIIGILYFNQYLKSLTKNFRPTSLIHIDYENIR